MQSAHKMTNEKENAHFIVAKNQNTGEHEAPEPSRTVVTITN